MELLFVLAVIAFLASPIMALWALVRVNKLSQESRSGLAANTAARLAALERAVGELNRKLRGLTARGPATPEAAGMAEAPPKPPAPPPLPTMPPEPKPAAAEAPPATPPTPASGPFTPKPAPPPQPSGPAGGLDLETLIAGRWLNRIGIVALLTAVTYFLKLAFDNDWVGPTGQVVIGLLAGALLLVYSQWLLNRGWDYFSNSITGLAAGVLYLSVWAASQYYHLIPRGLTFVGMIAVTAGLVAIALGRNSQAVAVIALAGGFLTPRLMSTGVDAQITLFSYLALLNGGMLVVARLRSWRSLEWLSFVSTVVYFVGWYNQFYEDPKLLLTAFFATLYFAEFGALPVLKVRREGLLRDDQIGMLILNAVWFLGALHAMLYTDYRWALTFAILTLAATHLGVIRLLPAEDKEGGPSVARLLFAGLALTFATLAIPIRLEGKWITMAWAVEGAVLVWSSFRAAGPLLRRFGLLLFALVFALLFDAPAGHYFLLNPRFVTFAVAAAAFAVAYYFAQKNSEALSEDERMVFGWVGLAANVTLLWGLSMEIWDVTGRREMIFDMGRPVSQLTSLAMLWILYGTVLITAGCRRRWEALRLQGLVLYAPGLLLVVFGSIPALRVFWNPRFVSHAVTVACFAAVFYLSRQIREELSESDVTVFNLTGLAANVLLWWTLSLEVWDGFGRMAPEGPIDPALAQQLGLSLLWIVYATVLVVWGVRRSVPVLRWQGLILFGLVVAKVFVIDSSYLEQVYRVLSFLALGVLLMIVSFLYQKRLAADRTEKQP